MDFRRSRSAPSANLAESRQPAEVSSVPACAGAGPAQKGGSAHCLPSPNCKFKAKTTLCNTCESPDVRISPYLTDSTGNIVVVRSCWRAGWTAGGNRTESGGGTGGHVSGNSAFLRAGRAPGGEPGKNDRRGISVLSDASGGTHGIR